MKALRTIVTRVVSKGLTEIIPVVQSDSGRSIDFVISDMTIPSGATATFYALKPDDTEVFSNCTISENTVTVNLVTQTLAVIGVAHCQVQIISGSDIVTTFEFALRIERSLVSGSSIESSNDFSALQDALRTASGLQSEIDSTNERVDESDKKISEISGEFDALLERTPRYPFLETADVEPYAQSIIDNVVAGGYGIQGMAIGTWDSTDYMLCCHVDGTTLTGTNLTLYNMDAGEIAAQKTG
ncbi:MAG: BppU family phage baseplate upper protein, partial [Lachnospiraceae bacterium]